MRPTHLENEPDLTVRCRGRAEQQLRALLALVSARPLNAGVEIALTAPAIGQICPVWGAT